MRLIQAVSVFVMVAALPLSLAGPAERGRDQPTHPEMMDRLRKMADQTKKIRPSHAPPEGQQPISKKESAKTSTTANASTTTTTTTPPAATDAPSVSTTEKPLPPPPPPPPAPPVVSNQNYHQQPWIPEETLSQIQNHVNNFQAANDPYNQIQVVPFRPPPLTHNNYLQYLQYLRNRQNNNIFDRFTNFAGNFFPIEIDVPDLVGSLTSWIPGSQLIGQILTGNRPNSRRFAILAANGQLYMIEVPQQFQPQATQGNLRMPYPNPYLAAPYGNFGNPYMRPFAAQIPPFNRFFRSSYPNLPPVFYPKYHNNPYLDRYQDSQTQDERYGLVQSRVNEGHSGLPDEEYAGRFQDNSNVAILANQMYNGNLHIPEDGVLVHNGRGIFPQSQLYPVGRSLQGEDEPVEQNN